jgi:hypothetical protein
MEESNTISTKAEPTKGDGVESAPTTQQPKPTGRLLSLEEAADQIKSTHLPAIGTPDVKRSTKRFFFLIGAGVSSPPIPLASGIISRCRELIEKSNPKGYARLTKEIADCSSIGRYERYLRAAFPNPFQRADYFTSLIHAAPISHANLRLAHLLTATSDKLLTELVVTTNFDELLFTSLRLFGKDPQVFAHPAEFYRVPLDGDVPIIVHLHGRVHNYDVANLGSELRRSARSGGLQSFLDHVLAERSPIVIGYSGWEGDAFMSNLKIRLASDTSLKANIYWFCYSLHAYQELPSWLKERDEVFFIVPGDARASSAPPKNALSEPRFGAPGFQYDIAETTTLPATQVLDQLIRAFNIDPPEFTSSPISFIAKRIRAVLPDDDSSGNNSIRFEARNYFLRRISRTIEEVATHFEVDSQLLAVLQCVRRSDYETALTLGGRIWRDIVDKRAAAEERAYDLYDLQDALWTAVMGFDADGDAQCEKRCVDGYSIVCDICSSLLACKTLALQNEDREYVVNRLARALLYKGILLGQHGEWVEAYEAIAGSLKHVEPAAGDWPTEELRLWRAINMIWVIYRQRRMVSVVTGTQGWDVRGQEVLAEASCLLRRLRPRIGEASELERAYVQAAFNKACLEAELKADALGGSLADLKSIAHPRLDESREMIEEAVRWSRSRT